MARKLVHVTTNLGIGGAETQLLTLIQALGTTDYEHTVIAFYNGAQKKRLESLGVTVHIIRGYFFQYDPILLFTLIKYIRTIRPTAVHIQLWAAGIFGTVAARLAGHTKIIYVVHQQHIDSFIRSKVENISFWGAHTIVAVSDSVAHNVKQRLPRRWLKKLVIIPNGIFFKESTKKFTQKNLLLGVVGRLVPIKNHALLLRAFARLCFQHRKGTFEGNLVIIGDGPEKTALMALAQQRAIESRIIWAGEVNAHDWYPMLDGYVSSSYSEGMSIALLEALSYGIPVITTSREKTHDIIRNGIDGWVIPVADEHALYNALVDWVDNPDICAQYGQSGKNRALNFSAEIMGARYERIFT